LNTSEDKGIAYVETKNLDGETNLKLKNTQKELFHWFPYDGFESCQNTYDGSVEVAGPNNDIYKFDGKLNYKGKTESLISDNFVLKGSKLRNTSALYGVVIYSGHTTKVMMNSSKPRFKISDLERLTNQTILIIFISQFILATIAAIVGTT
jgi:phospholipid-transporting ATPase